MILSALLPSTANNQLRHAPYQMYNANLKNSVPKQEIVAHDHDHVAPGYSLYTRDWTMSDSPHVSSTSYTDSGVIMKLKKSGHTT
jgi:hypothetical protein